MYFFMIFVCFASTYGFLLDTSNPQSSGGQNVAKYLTLSEFYDTKTKLQNGIDQTRSETRDLRLDVDNKMSLLTSQLQQMFSAFQQQVTNNGIANENETLETLEQKYNELFTKHTKLQDNFEAMQKMYVTQGDEILALKNSTREHIKLQDNFDSLQKMYLKQENELQALQNSTIVNSQKIAEVKSMKSMSQVFDLHAIQQKVNSISSQTQALQVNEQARNQDFQALYNLTVTSGKQTENRLKEIARNQTWANIDIYNRFQNFETSQNATFDSINKNIKKSETHQNEALKTLNQTMKTVVAIQNTAFDSKLQERDKRSNLSLTVVKQAIAKNSEQDITEILKMHVALTACVKSDYGTKPVGHIIKFDDIRTQRNINNMSSFKSSGKFTCQSNGLYLVSAWVMSPIFNSEFAVYKNGNSIANGYITNNGRNEVYSATTVVAVELQINDTVWVQVKQQLYAYGDRRSCLTIIKVK